MKLSQPPKSLIYILALAIAALVLSACGGDDSSSSSSSIDGDSDPQTVLDQAFGSDSTIDSADIDLAVEIGAQGADGGAIDLQLDGPFQSRGEDQLPMLDLNLSAKADAAGSGGQGFDFQGGATITDEAAFLTVDDQAYAVDPSTFSVFQNFYAQSVAAQVEAEGSQQSSALFEQLGVDPQTWLTNVSNEGVEDRDGTEVVHITGDADVAKILEDSQAIAQQTGQADQIDPADAQRLNDSVKDAQIDVYVGTDDGILRGFAGNISFADEGEGKSGSDQADINFSLALSGVNEDLEFTAPTETKPLSELEGLEGLGGLGGLGAGGGSAPSDPRAGSGGAGGGAQGEPTAPSGGDAAGGGGGPGGGGGDPYLECLNQAETPEAVQECANAG